MTLRATRQPFSLLLAGLLCGAPVAPREQAPSPRPLDSEQASPHHSAADDSQLAMAPRPNPKYAKKVADLGEKAIAEGRFDEALSYYDEAVRYAPQDQNLLQRAAQLRSRLVRDHADAAERDALAGHADVAVEELAKALLIDPSNTIVAERMKEMRAMNDAPGPRSGSKIEGLPELTPRPGKQNLNLRGDAKTVYQQLCDLFGIKAAFDADLPARNVQLRLEDVDFETALKVLTAETGTFYRALTPTLLFVAQDITEKRRQYAPVAEQAFLLPAAVGNDEMNELLRLL